MKTINNKYIFGLKEKYFPSFYIKYIKNSLKIIDF